MPPFSKIIEVTHRKPNRDAYLLPCVSFSMLMGFRRDNVEMPNGRIYWCIDRDGWLQIHPEQNKELILRVRYLPPEKEV